jgi:hypothetical protein
MPPRFAYGGRSALPVRAITCPAVDASEQIAQRRVARVPGPFLVPHRPAPRPSCRAIREGFSLCLIPLIACTTGPWRLPSSALCPNDHGAAQGPEIGVAGPFACPRKPSPLRRLHHCHASLLRAQPRSQWNNPGLLIYGVNRKSFKRIGYALT